MDYDILVNKLSKGNVFLHVRKDDNKYDDFYNYYDPIDVYVLYDNNEIHFIPYEKIDEVTKEYSFIKCNYVFATCNGDPIFIMDNKVYTCAHGTKNPKYELLSNSFDEFLDILSKE